MSQSNAPDPVAAYRPPPGSPGHRAAYPGPPPAEYQPPPSAPGHHAWEAGIARAAAARASGEYGLSLLAWPEKRRALLEHYGCGSPPEEWERGALADAYAWGTGPDPRQMHPSDRERHGIELWNALGDAGRQAEREKLWEREARAAAYHEERVRQLRCGLLAPPPGTWVGHLMWLRRFGDAEFTTLAVRDAARDGGWIAPPDFAARLGHWRDGTQDREHDPADAKFALRLGQAYGRIKGEPIEGWLLLKPGGVTHNIRRWRVLAES